MKQSIKSYRNEIRFVILFVLIFMAGQTLHFLTRSYTTPFYVHLLNAKMSSLVINIITPGENTVSQGPLIRSERASISIDEGCEGIEGILLFIAAVLAFNAQAKQKVLGIIAGSITLHLSNITRLVSLYYTTKYNPALFDVMHIFIGQTYIIFICLILFITWAYYCTRQS